MAQSGSSGLFDLPLADPGCPWQLRMGAFGAGFVQYNFLLQDDRNEQLDGGVQFSSTLGSYFELWLQVGTRANRNLRPTTEMSPSMQPTLALGQTALGLKLHSGLGRLWHFAVQPTVRVHSGPFDFGPNFSSTDVGIDMLGSLDLASVWSRFPLRLSARVGYLYDRSSTLLAALDCMAEGLVECLSTRLVYTTAYDVGQPRVQFGLGLDTHFNVGSVAIGPTLSYSLAVVTSDGDPVLRAQLAMQTPPVAPDDVDARVAQLLTLGARLLLPGPWPWPASVDLGMRVALSSWGYAMGPRLPQVAGYGALSFALDLAGGRLSAKQKGRAAADAGLNREARPGSAADAPPSVLSPSVLASMGLVHGVVRDARTHTPLAGAVVRFIGVSQNPLLTDERGEYRSALLPLGPLAIEASRGDHLTARMTVAVRPGETVAANLGLERAARAALALFWVELSDEANGTPTAIATLSRQGQGRGSIQTQGEGPALGQVVEMAPQPGGGPGVLYARLPGGSWRVRIDAAGYLSREQVVFLPAGEERRLSVRLLKRPQLPRVRLGSGEILLSESLLFTGDALHPQLQPASDRLLDEVIDLLIHHPELSQVRIETLGQGNEAQLIAVRDYLIQCGISPGRVIAVEASGESHYERSPHILFRVVR
jgi:hypothetical protein